MQPHIAFDRVLKRFGDVEVIIDPFSLDIPRNEFVVFLGPSGCGKTTLMRIAGGLDEPSGGTVMLLGEVIRKPDRRRGMVSQSYSSFPWLTVAENIAFGMRYRNDLGPAEKRERRDHYLALVGLTDFADAYPAHISGGMRQRVAIARTLAAGSEVLLMDEPFGALELHQREAHTVIIVTHDVEEAAFLADRIIIFSRRPARVLREVSVSERLGNVRPLELRDSPEFFALRTELLQAVRASAEDEE